MKSTQSPYVLLVRRVSKTCLNIVGNSSILKEFQCLNMWNYAICPHLFNGLYSSVFSWVWCLGSLVPVALIGVKLKEKYEARCRQRFEYRSDVPEYQLRTFFEAIRWPFREVKHMGHCFRANPVQQGWFRIVYVVNLGFQFDVVAFGLWFPLKYSTSCRFRCGRRWTSWLIWEFRQIYW